MQTGRKLDFHLEAGSFSDGLQVSRTENAITFLMDTVLLTFLLNAGWLSLGLCTAAFWSPILKAVPSHNAVLKWEVPWGHTKAVCYPRATAAFTYCPPGLEVSLVVIFSKSTLASPSQLPRLVLWWVKRFLQHCFKWSVYFYWVPLFFFLESPF